MIAGSKSRKRRSKAKAAATHCRVAIYTRKSVPEGLEQEFNSLDAQRQSIEHYVASQEAEGWVALPEHYDDGGYTGATTKRPAFQRLLQDIKADGVDVVAVYKIDRLSRSLADFAQLMDLFDRHGVTFVSVTQQFNSTSSMGRFTLNIMASFAEFERDMIAERTRDKVLASRRRGMWTGGRPILGYDIEDKRLVVNEVEAGRVRAIFALYQEAGSLLATAQELGHRDWRTKTWTNGAGTLVSGGTFTKGTLHTLLTNPLYIGKLRAGDDLCNGQHEAIVDEETWDAVHEQLAAQAVQQPERRRPWRPNKNGGLLQGLVRCAVCGSPFSYHYTSKAKGRYSYMVCAKALREGAAACPGSRVAAGEFEQFVVERIRDMGRDPAVLDATLAADKRLRKGKREDLRRALAELDPIWAELFPAERARVLALLIDRVDLNASSGDVEITFREGAPAALTMETEP